MSATQSLSRNALVFTVVLCLSAQATLTSTWASSSMPSSSENRHVLIIQDIHADLEVQRAIGQQIQSLVQRHAVDFVALEGSRGSIALSRFQLFPDKRRLAAVSDYLLRRNKITGPISVAMQSKVAWPPVAGVDSAARHAANVEAYIRSTTTKSQIISELEYRRRILSAQTAKLLSGRLRSFDELVEQRVADNVSLTEFIAHARAFTPIELSPPLLRYMRAAELESALKTPVLQAERKHYVAAVLARINEQERSELSAQLLLSKQDGEKLAWVESRLFDLGEKNQISLSSYPTLSKYAQYVSMMKEVRSSSLLDAIQTWEDNSYLALATTRAEKDLIENRRALRLMSRLSHFELTPAEWTRYRETVQTDRTAPRWASFENFYLEADARSRMMAENVVADMTALGSKNAVLVCGGFHQAAIASQLRSRGFVVEVTQPRIVTVPQDTDAALQLFLASKDSLENFLSIPASTLSAPAFEPVAQELAKIVVVAAAASNGSLPAATTVASELAELGSNLGVELHEASPDGAVQFDVTDGQTALPVRLDMKDGEVISVDAAGSAKKFPTMHSPVRLPARNNSEILKEGDEVALMEWLFKHSKADKKAARKFAAVWAKIKKTWPVLEIEGVQFRIVEKGVALAKIEDNVIEIEHKLIDYPLLLEMELMEECHHFLFQQMVLAAGGNPQNKDAIFIEELVTDQEKIRFFKTLKHNEHFDILQTLFEKFHTPDFAELLLMTLPARDRRRLIAGLYDTRAIDNSLRKKLLDRSHLINGTKGTEQINFLLRSYYKLINEYVPRWDNWEERAGQHREEFSQFLEGYHPRRLLPLAGGGYFKLLPKREDVHVSPVGDVESDDAYWKENFGGKVVAVFEPHPDDAAIAMDVTLREIKKVAKRVILLTALPDYIGVTDDFALGKMKDGDAQSNPAISIDDRFLKRVKLTVRRDESEAYARQGLGLPGQDMWAPNIVLPHGTPRGPYEELELAPLLEQANIDLGDDRFQLEGNINDLEELGTSVWILPHLFIKGQHHSHHETINIALVQKLRKMFKAKAKSAPLVMFYETYEHAIDFDGEGVNPNLIAGFDQTQMKRKKENIELYESQVSRRPYQDSIEARNQSYRSNEDKKAGKKTPKSTPYAERFLVGRFVSDPADNVSEGKSNSSQNGAHELGSAILAASGVYGQVGIAMAVVAVAWYFGPRLILAIRTALASVRSTPAKPDVSMATSQSEPPVIPHAARPSSRSWRAAKQQA